MRVAEEGDACVASVDTWSWYGARADIHPDEDRQGKALAHRGEMMTEAIQGLRQQNEVFTEPSRRYA